MSFRKRNVGLSGPGSKSNPSSPQSIPTLSPGLRASPIDGRPTTSTGTQTLDDLLGGHAGLPLGHSLLIGENGTTDFAGAILRFYAAEGVVQGHQVHVVGAGEQWGRDLPGLVGMVKDGGAEAESSSRVDKEKMKIAWRYEKLGEFGSGRDPSRAPASPLPNRTVPSTPSTNPFPLNLTPFTHTFDLTKRLLPPPTSPPINHIPLSTSQAANANPYTAVLTALTLSLATSPPANPHRFVLPSLLSPALYPPTASDPTHLLPFLHSLRALLRLHAGRLIAMLSLPLSLHPRGSGLTRWVELLCDGVVELAPFGGGIEVESLGGGGGGGAGGKEEKAQGMLRVHRVPVGTERGAGSGAGGDDLSFCLTRRRFVVRPFHLPPVLGEQEGGGGEKEGVTGKGEMEF